MLPVTTGAAIEVPLICPIISSWLMGDQTSFPGAAIQ